MNYLFLASIIAIMTFSAVEVEARDRYARDRDYRDRLYERYAPHHRVYRYNPYIDPYAYYYGTPDYGYYYNWDYNHDDAYYRRGRVMGPPPADGY